MSELETHVATNEVAKWVRWRRREALAAGMSRIEAAEYAESDISAQDLRDLVALHCPAELLAQVLGCGVPV